MDEGIVHESLNFSSIFNLPILYVCDIDPENIIMHKNFPFEFIIKKGVKCSKIGEKNLKENTVFKFFYTIMIQTQK